MDEAVRRALAMTPASGAWERTIDITTTGARSGRARRIEVWFYRADGKIYLTTTPARRDWYANIVANPRFTFHLKHGVWADLAATGTPVLDPNRRAAVFTSVIADLDQPSNEAGMSGRVPSLQQWLDGSPLIQVRFDED